MALRKLLGITTSQIVRRNFMVEMVTTTPGLVSLKPHIDVNCHKASAIFSKSAVV
jgi:hypothetical protein